MTRLKKIFWLVGICLSGFYLTSCQARPSTAPSAKPEQLLKVYQLPKKAAYQDQTQALTHFIKTSLVTKAGLYTNIRNDQPRQAVATGHEYLSESSGFWLTHLALSGSAKAFRAFYQQTKTTFDQKAQQFSYRYDPDVSRRYGVNATLDDLRILRALVLFDAVHHTQTYQKEATTRFSRLQKHCLPDGRLLSYYDVTQKKGASSGALAYYDLWTIRYFAGVKTYRQALKYVQKGYLGDAFPLYAAAISWSDQRYSETALNTSEALTTLLHLAEVRQLKDSSRNWLISRVTQKQLYNRYSINGTVEDRNQSPANYALAALIFAADNDTTHYNKAMQQVWASQTQQADTRLNGSISQAQADQIYAYNNLTALNAAEVTAKLPQIKS